MCSFHNLQTLCIQNNNSIFEFPYGSITPLKKRYQTAYIDSTYQFGEQTLKFLKLALNSVYMLASDEPSDRFLSAGLTRAIFIAMTSPF